MQHRISNSPCRVVFNDNVPGVMERPRTPVAGCGRREEAGVGKDVTQGQLVVGC